MHDFDDGPATGTGSLVVAEAPVATTSAATGLTGTAATLNGSVNAGGGLDHGHLLLQHLEHDWELHGDRHHGERFHHPR